MQGQKKIFNEKNRAADTPDRKYISEYHKNPLNQRSISLLISQYLQHTLVRLLFGI